MLRVYRREYFIATGGRRSRFPDDQGRAKSRREMDGAAGVQAGRTGKELTVLSEGSTGARIQVFRIFTPILTTLSANQFNLSFSPPNALSHIEDLGQPRLIGIQFKSHMSF